MRMLIHLRTTLIIEDRLLGAAKREAAKRGMTLSALVNEVLREALRASPVPAAPHFEMLTFGGRGKLARHTSRRTSRTPSSPRIETGWGADVRISDVNVLVEHLVLGPPRR